MFRLVCVLVSLLLLPVTSRGNGERYAANSVLAEGKWVKIRVDDTGICKLTYAELQKMGFADPSQVAVYGYGGWIQEEDFTDYTKNYIDDLPQIPSWKGTDYLLFYARGPRKWELNGQYFEHTNNPYSDYGYYMLSDVGGAKEMTTSTAISQGSPLQTFSTFDDYVCYERDSVSVNDSGRELFGESFSYQTVQNFNFRVPGITTDPGYMGFRFISRPSSGIGKASLSIGIQPAVELTFNSSLITNEDNNYYIRALGREGKGPWIPDGNERITTQLVYSQQGYTNAHLDYIRLQMKRILQPYGAYTFFRTIKSVNAVSRYIIQGANANTLVWDVTDGLNPQLIPASLSGQELSFTIPAGQLREFVIVEPAQSGFLRYETMGEVANQNLHALSQPDMVIVSPPAFIAQAERLAEAHIATGRLKTIHIVTQEEIFNEFSSGTPDATAIRKFMKMFYDRSSSEEDAPRYLLLFGNGAYDNRLRTRAWAGVSGSGLLLTYQTQESLNSKSFTYDLYFGILADGTGSMLYRNSIDVGVGRLPIRSVTQAKSITDKLIAYINNEHAGDWKNRLVFMSDDHTTTDETFMNDSDELAEIINTGHPQYQVEKIYYDAYRKDFSGLATYPDVRTQIQQQLKDGIFLFNYVGHGDVQSLSNERIITLADITEFKYKALPVWVTATCDFTRFDAVATSAGEQVLLNESSGGIALFTTTRVAFMDENRRFNKSLIQNLFEKNSSGSYPALGDIMKNASNGMGVYERKLGFALIGDPALTLNYPQYNMGVTAVNGVEVKALDKNDENPLTFKAQEWVTVEGEVYTPAGTLAADFNGQISATVLDSKVARETLDNNGIDRTFTYEDYGGTLYTGTENVENGKFSFTFKVPKDISYSGDHGKIILYALDQESNREANGFFSDYLVGGTATGGEDDDEGPEIRTLYLNDSTFVDGGKVNTTPFFYAHIWDKSGINITGNSLGHDITLSIDGWPATTYTLNSYFETIAGSEGEGIVRYSIPALAVGQHTAEFTVWDVMNNVTTTTFSFEVVEGLKPFLAEIKATPNPAREQVEFSLYHNRPESRMKVIIMVYDMTGRLHWKHEESGSSDYFDAYKVTWDLRSNGGGRVRPGVYIYRAA
ncbi:MAG: type IX secretion system sortase PorU, partial [Tannerellaceae bacterium]|nr:type IX secretion system sortase PorU [Tannerellaceae bacterium]